MAEAQYEDSTDEMAAYGTVCHEVSATCLIERTDPVYYIGAEYVADGHTFTFDKAMCEIVEDYINEIREDTPKGADTHIEERIKITEDCWGTPDRQTVVGTNLRTNDLKTGYIIQYPDGPQLRIYSLGGLKRLDPQRKITNVTMRIHQHTYGASRVAIITRVELERWEVEVLLPAIEDAKSDNPTFKTGDWCKYCKHKGNCPTWNTKSGAIAKRSQRPLEGLSDAELGEVISAGASIVRYFAEAEKEGLRRAIRGNPPLTDNGPYEVGLTSRHRVWKGPAEIKAKKLFGSNAFDVTLKTPAQMSKIDGGKNFVKEYGYQPEGNPKLVPPGTPGEKYKPVGAVQAFAAFIKQTKERSQ